MSDDFKGWIKSIIIALLLAFFIRGFVVEHVVIAGESMMPTLHSHERVIVNKLDYLFNSPRRWDLVTFEYKTGRSFVKRIVGMPGDVVEIKNGDLYINGLFIEEPYVDSARGNFGPEKVPENHFFLLGDNRNYSRDSRCESVGFVPAEKIEGRAAIVFWPPDNTRHLIPGAKQVSK